MAQVTELPASGYTEMPWRNGGGVTREIAIDPAPGAAAPFRWRLSMADLAGPGPFSELPDVDRVLVLLAGDGVTLAIDGAAPVPLGRHEAIRFPADVPTELAMPPGSGRDLNLMWDRTRATGAVELLGAGDHRDVDAPVAFAVALDGPADVAVDGAVHALGEQDGLRIDAGGALAIVAGAVCLATVA